MEVTTRPHSCFHVNIIVTIVGMILCGQVVVVVHACIHTCVRVCVCVFLCIVCVFLCMSTCMIEFACLLMGHVRVCVCACMSIECK
jgi:hypothetical protein